MSTGTPDKPIPRRIDPRKSAHQGAVYSGLIPGETLPRLREAVTAVHSVTAEITFSIGDQGEKLLTGQVTGEVELVCQRCLEPLRSPIASDLALAVVWDEEGAKQLPGIWDPWITGEGEGDLYEILEEELLLSLPVVALHEQECVDKALFVSGDAAESETDKPSNPFQVLKQLKEKH